MNDTDSEIDIDTEASDYEALALAAGAPRDRALVEVPMSGRLRSLTERESMRTLADMAAYSEHEWRLICGPVLRREARSILAAHGLTFRVMAVLMLPDIVQHRMWRLEPRLSAIEGRLVQYGSINSRLIRIEDLLDRLLKDREK
jgi:hypothetical protein